MTLTQAVTERANAVLERVLAEPDRISPSIYETARIVALAAWLPGHDRRVRFLVDAQNADGTWGEPDGYSVVPTLSAVEALLAVVQNGTVVPPVGDETRCLETVDRGLVALSETLHAEPFADMIASELLVPALVDDINDRLARLSDACPLNRWASTRFEIPDQAEVDTLARIRNTTSQVSPKLHHTLELFGARARGLESVSPDNGNLGCSPASTAAWADPESRDPQHVTARTYVDNTLSANAGLAPGVFPITRFEHSWTVASLLSAGVAVTPPDAMLASLRESISDDGTSVAPGLLTDSDSTAAALFALYMVGEPYRPDSLLSFDAGTHFQLWPGERNPSVSANAHVLETLCYYANVLATDTEEFSSPIHRVSRWLRQCQRPNGCWYDKWHASPFYATIVCVRALLHTTMTEPVENAVAWVLSQQRDDGGWGLWDSTAEETAYAIQILLRPSITKTAECVPAARRGMRFLRELPADYEHPALWHDKDLYAPLSVIDAEVLAAEYLVDSHREANA